MRNYTEFSRRILNTLLCTLVLCAFFFVGTLLSQAFPFPVTGALYGMGLLLICLFVWTKFAEWMISAVKPLVANMVFFFIPAVMGITHYLNLLTDDATGLFIAVVLTTIVCLGVTAKIASALLQKPDIHDDR